MITELSLTTTVTLLELSGKTLTSLEERSSDEVNTLIGLTLVESPPTYYALIKIDSGGVPVGSGTIDWNTTNW